jgi:uncharacterized protein
MNLKKPLSFILVKPSGPDCNLACSYCFYTRNEAYFGSGHIHRMSDEVLEAMIRKSLGRPGQQMGFGWQGGEPTLMGLDFYRRAIELQERYGNGMRVSNSLQTNGVLINDEWNEFLKQHNFLVGLSLDGPAHVHDHYRVDRGGRGTHAIVENTARSMLEAGVAVNAISVVSDYSSRFAQEIYTYHKSLGFEYQQFIPCIEMEADGSKAVAGYSVTPEKYGRFLCDLFDLWADDWVDGKPTTSIRTFETFAEVYLGRVPSECSARRTCGEYLVVEHTGEVYSCDFFVEDAWKLGNILEDNPEEMLNGYRQTLFGNMKGRLPDKCLKCPWLGFCQGGCTKDRLRDPHDKRFNHFCESYKMFFAHADTRFKELMESFSCQTRI